ncbi:MAG: hypothetical protein RLZZ361_652, partial [Cyanobacteriota bacterium]
FLYRTDCRPCDTKKDDPLKERGARVEFENGAEDEIPSTDDSPCDTKKDDPLKERGARVEFENGAEDEIRTRDPLLGKEMLYH